MIGFAVLMMLKTRWIIILALVKVYSRGVQRNYSSKHNS